MDMARWRKIATMIIRHCVRIAEHWSERERMFSAIVDAMLSDKDDIVIIDNDYAGKRWIVMGSERDGMTKMPLLTWALLGEKKRLSTEDVAAFFRARAAGISEKDASVNDTLAPVARDSLAWRPIGGDLPTVAWASEDIQWGDNIYYWYDLEEVSVGESVYRISSTPTLHLFRREHDGWTATVTPFEWHGDLLARLQGAFFATREIESDDAYAFAGASSAADSAEEKQDETKR